MPHYQPTGRSKFFGFQKEITKETLIEYIQHHIKTDAYWAYGAAHAIACVYKMDMPWVWYIERILRRYDATAFSASTWVQTVIETIADVINRIEQISIDELGQTVGL